MSPDWPGELVAKGLCQSLVSIITLKLAPDDWLKLELVDPGVYPLPPLGYDLKLKIL